MLLRCEPLHSTPLRSSPPHSRRLHPHPTPLHSTSVHSAPHRLGANTFLARPITARHANSRRVFHWLSSRDFAFRSHLPSSMPPQPRFADRVEPRRMPAVSFAPASSSDDIIIISSPARKRRAKGLPQPPHVLRGDWCRTKRSNGGRCYIFPPSAGRPQRGRPLGPSGTYLGPVHAVEYTDRFVAVLVPHPAEATLLVWVNVWTNRNEAGWLASVFFCDKVDHEEVAAWLQAGWENRFID